LLVDTHAHLDADQYREDLEAVIARAEAAGVQSVVTVGTDIPSSRRAVALADRYRGIYAAVGIHPHDARVGEGALEEIGRLAQHPRVVAIGEIGLDFYRDRSPRAVQRNMFERQLELATELGKPIIVHDREAHSETMETLENWIQARPDGSRKPAGVLHCFSGDLQMAHNAIDWGFCLSVAGPLTYPNAHRLRQTFAQLPLRSILVETDCPYLTPQSHRGQRNEPALVVQVAERLAQLHGREKKEIEQITTRNAQALFDLPRGEESFG
jgi:TatD DNase family protein